MHFKFSYFLVQWSMTKVNNSFIHEFVLTQPIQFSIVKTELGAQAVLAEVGERTAQEKNTIVCS